MFIGSFFSSFHFGDDDGSVFIVNPIDDSKVANTNAIERLRQFLAPYGSWGLLEFLNCL